ncbi:response regulator transcription factor [Pseudoxanthomonas dokdonensis]|uniref:LuxR family transcriptional regulator n=1 Tax=Pseudoxanthomonas dokdonensis TaxID=344882 RepID=A0A0R0CG90_9GAMM|nr:response regulator transcription factor [Pseudoxanthomonas dokdonensis]KRG68767.1 hypothetical protein ABB29_09710 [Pseudoxanthomonas dokdonensis]
MKKKIIIADDHPVVMLGARMLIENAGLGEVVAEVTTPAELHEALASHECDLLIADLSMPVPGMVDGYGMIAGVRHRYPQLPILLMTSMANIGILERLLVLGNIGVVGKGADMDELPSAVHAVNRGSTYVSREIRARREGMHEAGATAAHGSLDLLSPKEMEVVRLLLSGLSVTQVAEALHRSKATISRQKHSAMKKLAVRNDVELYEIARAGL